MNKDVLILKESYLEWIQARNPTQDQLNHFKYSMDLYSHIPKDFPLSSILQILNNAVKYSLTL